MIWLRSTHQTRLQKKEPDFALVVVKQWLVVSGKVQQFGGSCAAVIGHYVIDPWLLLDAGVAHELIRPQDYASDSVVLTFSLMTQ